MVLHGNRAERLAETVFSWLQGNPLAPLEEEVLLVQAHRKFKRPQTHYDQTEALPLVLIWP